MYQRILIPLDGSPGAERVLPVATQLARHVRGAVILLRVVSSPEGGKPATREILDRASASEDADHTLAAAYLADIAARQELAGVRKEAAVRDGVVAEVIVAVTAETHADLIVLSRRSTSAASRLRTQLGRHVRIGGEHPFSHYPAGFLRRLTLMVWLTAGWERRM